MKKRVVITGLGIVSPVGNEVEKFWANVIKGESGVSHITQFDASEF
ncbi:MAG: beta-ketoacyl synthase N-terminal-like domain-containing protein, partial [Candidatus Omnitrophica bacterium]|nr:beta-ketoacyl synthase N-terminal-like domain-containing protein [Candidatus Omnitrophota bacterium]